MNRRGQAALEFLTTYGWALLVILVMIGAISYFGVANPSKLLPSRCISGTEISCSDFLISADDEAAYLKLQQSLGKTIYFQGVSCRYNSLLVPAELSVNGAILAANDAWSPRFPAQITCDFSGAGLSVLQDQKIKIYYNMTYTLTLGGFPHEVEGDLYTEVQ